MDGQDVFETCYEVLSQNSSTDANENCEYIKHFIVQLMH